MSSFYFSEKNYPVRKISLHKYDNLEKYDHIKKSKEYKFVKLLDLSVGGMY